MNLAHRIRNGHRMLGLTTMLLATSLQAAPGGHDFGPVSPEVLQSMDSVSTAFIMQSILDMPFKTAVHVRVANGKVKSLQPERGARGNAATVAVYRSVLKDPTMDPNIGTLPAQLQDLAPIDFTVARDAVHGWALMSQTGQPALQLSLHGETSAHASASWSVSYKVPGSGKRAVYVRFRLPPAGFDGRFEQGAHGPMRARLRTDLLVNGLPAWSNETMRASTAGTPGQVGHITETHHYIEQFGETLPFDDANEKVDARTINWKIGVLNAGQVLDITMLYFVEAIVEPHCNLKNDMYACSGMVVSFKRESTSHPAAFYSYPAK